MKNNIMFLKLILSGLIFIAAAAFINNETIQLSNRLNYILPTHYDIMLTSYIKSLTFSDTCNISIETDIPTQYIKLYSNVTIIIDATVFNDTSKTYYQKGIIKIYNSTNESVLAECFFKNVLPPGNYTLKLTFFNSITNIKGIRVFHNKTKHW